MRDFHQGREITEDEKQVQGVKPEELPPISCSSATDRGRDVLPAEPPSPPKSWLTCVFLSQTVSSDQNHVTERIQKSTKWAMVLDLSTYLTKKNKACTPSSRRQAMSWVSYHGA